MFDINVPHEVKRYSWNLVNSVNFGRRNEFNGDRLKQYVGMIAQTCACDAYGLPRPTGDDGFDNGVDLELHGKFCDIKCMTRTTEVKWYFVNNLVASQVEGSQYLTDAYIFASYNRLSGVLTVCGAISKNDVRRCDRFDKEYVRTRADGTQFKTMTGLYEVPMRMLAPVKNWYELASYVGSL